MKKLLTLFVGIILGIVLVFGGVVGFGFWVVSKDKGMGTIDDMIPQISFSDEIRNMNVMGYVTKLQALFTNINTTNLGVMEDTIGISLTPMLANMLGIDPAVIRDANISTLPNKIIDSFTIDTLQAKFGFTLPDMPLFQDKEFRSQPLLEAFNSLSAKLSPTTMSIMDLETNFGIKLSDNPIFNDPAIANAKVADLGAALNQVQLASMLGVVFKTDIDKFNATHVADAAALTAWKVGKIAYVNRGTGGFDYFDTVAEQTKYIAEFNAATPAPTKKLIEKWAHLRTEEMTAIKNELNPPTPPTPPTPPPVPAPPAVIAPPTGYDFAPEVAPVVSAVGEVAPPLSSAIIQKLAVNKLGDMTGTGGSDKVLNGIINTCTLGDIIELKPTDGLLYDLRDSKIMSIEGDIKKLPLKNIINVDPVTGSAAMKFLINEPLRKAPFWKVVSGIGTPTDPYVYELDASGNRIPIFEEDVGSTPAAPIYKYATIETMDAKIKQMVMGDMLPTGGTNVILNKLKYAGIENLDTSLTEVMNTTTIAELLPQTATSPVLVFLGSANLTNLDSKLNAMTIGDVLGTAQPGEHAILTKLRGEKINDLGSAFGRIIDTTTLGELIPMTDPSLSGSTTPTLLWALKDTTTANLSNKIGTLTLVEMFGEGAKTGVLGLINTKCPGTNIGNIATNATLAITTSTLEEMRTAGILPQYDTTPGAKNDQAATVVNMLIEKDNAKPGGEAKTTMLTLPGAIVVMMMTTKLGTLADAGLITLQAGAPSQMRDLTLQGLIDEMTNPKVIQIYVSTPPTKMSYKVGDTIDPTGGIVTKLMSNGTTQTTPLTLAMCTANTATPGTQISVTVTITDNGKTFTTSFPIVVTPV